MHILKVKSQQGLNKITFANITEDNIVKVEPTVIVVKHQDRKYCVSRKRLDESVCEPTTELFVSKDGKWLIPADTTSQVDVDALIA